jgi:hypothetical protein
MSCAASPTLDVGPRPEKALTELSDRFGEVVVTTPPTVHGLALRQTKALCDLCCSDDLAHIDLPGHGLDANARSSTCRRESLLKQLLHTVVAKYDGCTRPDASP